MVSLLMAKLSVYLRLKNEQIIHVNIEFDEPFSKILFQRIHYTHTHTYIIIIFIYHTVENVGTL